MARLPDPQESAPPESLARVLIAALCANDQATALRLANLVSPRLGAKSPLSLSPTANLIEYCGIHGHLCEMVLPARPVEIPPTSPFTESYVYDTEPVIFASLPGAGFIPGWDFLFGGDGTLLVDTGYLPLAISNRDFKTLFAEDINCIVHFSPSETAYIDEEVLFLSAPVANVGHWIVDFLPRLNGLRYAPAMGIKIAVPSEMPARYLEILSLFGIERERLIFCDRATKHHFRLVHCYKPGRSMPPNPVHVAFIRDRFRPDGPPLRPGKRIFLDRTSVGTRAIANDSEFRQFLSDENFLCADPSDLSMEQQRDLLQDAEVILGSYGSNLLAMYYAPPGCTVVALTNMTDDPVIAQTAFLLGLRHQRFACSAAPDPGRQRFNKDTDIIVDCAALRLRLETVGVG